MSRVGVFGDISPNLIDGSSIWLMSITEVLSHLYDEVVLILKVPVENDRLVSSLSNLRNVIIDEPACDRDGNSKSERSAKDAAERARKLIADGGLDAMIVRGLDSCNEFCRTPKVSDVLWSYVTDLPFPPSKISENSRNRLERIARRSKALFAQTESARSYLEALAPSATGKTYLLPPMIPDFAYATVSNQSVALGTDERPVRVVYAGKFAEQWRTLELLELPEKLADRGVESVLTVVGNKINRSRNNVSWRSQMEEALVVARTANKQSLRILGERSRAESIAEIADADFGIGWRTAELDSSLELSTKALEYAAAGAIPIINKNDDHLNLFGSKYPFFCTSNFKIDDLADLIADNLDKREVATDSANRVAEAYSMKAAVSRLKNIFKREGVFKRRARSVASMPTKLVIASHDLKFCGEIVSALQSEPLFEVRFDHWDSLHRHDIKKSNELAQWADVVFCEFAGPNLEFYSKAIPDGTRLVSRLHGFEVRNRAPWLSAVEFSRVESLVTVSEHYKRETEQFIPEALGRIQVIPNMLDAFLFDRPKHEFARFHIGMVGIVPFLKRPDRALDLMNRLLCRSSDFYLHIKGRMPWDYGYVWNDRLQYQQYVDFFRRAVSAPLSKHVIFEPFSTDIASWYRGIGYCLSPSSVESFHLAPAEGMASGAIPIVWNRPGAIEVFGREHVYFSIDEMVDAIVSTATQKDFNSKSEAVIAESHQWDKEVVIEKWFELLGGRDTA